jgi:kynurenine formamidase
VEQIPVEQLVGDAAVVDVSAKCASQPDYQVTVDDLTGWEKTNGSLNGRILLIRTDFSKRWPDAAGYLGTAERGEAAVPKLHFPGLHPDAARWLVANRTVKAVGIDTASIDFGQSTLFETHRALYERNIPGLENLTNLDRLPARGATVVALPMKIKGGSGAPLRAIAILPP